MKKSEWNEGLNHLDPDLIEKYIHQKDKIIHKNKIKRIWSRIGVTAASLILIVSTVVVVPLLKNDGTGKVPQFDVPVKEDGIYSAQDISKLFDSQTLSDGVTNAYTKKYVPDAKYLYIDEIPEEEYLDLYQFDMKGKSIDKEEYRDFVDSILPKLAKSLGVETPEYEIEEDEDFYNSDYLKSYVDIGNYTVSMRQTEVHTSFSFLSFKDNYRRILLDGELIQVDQSLSDEEIIASIQSIKNKLFDIFGVSFSDTKVRRYFDSYSKHGATSLYIYFYNKNERSNLMQSIRGQDYICISFDNAENWTGDIVSDDILTVANVSYTKYRNDSYEPYKLFAKAKKISLEEAEDLLYKGYVFGGHSCPICMSEQEKISFKGYDFVDIEYVDGMPFYAFYKKIGTAKNGNSIYAKTYVSAISLSGYDEYFESQKENH